MRKNNARIHLNRETLCALTADKRELREAAAALVTKLTPCTLSHCSGAANCC